jgi:hypothetical protein
LGGAYYVSQQSEETNVHLLIEFMLRPGKLEDYFILSCKLSYKEVWPIINPNLIL